MSQNLKNSVDIKVMILFTARGKKKLLNRIQKYSTLSFYKPRQKIRENKVHISGGFFLFPPLMYKIHKLIKII